MPLQFPSEHTRDPDPSRFLPVNPKSGAEFQSDVLRAGGSTNQEIHPDLDIHTPLVEETPGPCQNYRDCHQASLDSKRRLEALSYVSHEDVFQKDAKPEDHHGERCFISARPGPDDLFSDDEDDIDDDGQSLKDYEDLLEEQPANSSVDMPWQGDLSAGLPLAGPGNERAVPFMQPAERAVQTRDFAVEPQSLPDHLSPTESQLAEQGFEFHNGLSEAEQIARFGGKAFRKALREVNPELSRREQWNAWRQAQSENDQSDHDSDCQPPDAGLADNDPSKQSYFNAIMWDIYSKVLPTNDISDLSKCPRCTTMKPDCNCPEEHADPADFVLSHGKKCTCCSKIYYSDGKCAQRVQSVCECGGEESKCSCLPDSCVCSGCPHQQASLLNDCAPTSAPQGVQNDMCSCICGASCRCPMGQCSCELPPPKQAGSICNEHRAWGLATLADASDKLTEEERRRVLAAINEFKQESEDKTVSGREPAGIDSATRQMIREEYEQHVQDLIQQSYESANWSTNLPAPAISIKEENISSTTLPLISLHQDVDLQGPKANHGTDDSTDPAKEQSNESLFTPCDPSIRQSVEPESPNLRPHGPAVPYTPDRSLTPSPTSQLGTDIKMPDAPPTGPPSPAKPHLPLPPSSPDPISSPTTHPVTAPQTPTPSHQRSPSAPPTPAPAPPPTLTPKSKKPTPGSRRKSGVHGAKVDKSAGEKGPSRSRSRATSRKVTNAAKSVEKAAGLLTSRVKDAVARIEASVRGPGEENTQRRRSARIRARLAGMGK
jgi:hypothetical protein